MNRDDVGFVVHATIEALSQNQTAAAAQLLAQLVTRSDLEAWHADLLHARARQARLRRDHEFRHPSPVAIKASLKGGAPANAGDLRAVVLEEVQQLRRELRTDDTTPWKRYWNVDSKGRPTDPRIENECRDALLDRLRDRLRPYKIAASLPEARRGEETRADVLFLTANGRNVPLEAKRHFHAEIWSAASAQLQGYSSDVKADGFGIYLVFWFGNEATKTPARPDGTDGPTSAAEMEAMLIADLSAELRSHTEIIVFDVAKPSTGPAAKPRKKRAPSMAKPAPKRAARATATR